jgi:uncharacterized protein (TIGR00369 family)
MSSRPLDARALDGLRDEQNALGLTRSLDMMCLELKPGSAQVLQSVAPELRHANGSIPGVFLSGLADAAGSFAVATLLAGDEEHATASLHVQFVAAALRPTVTALAEVTRRTRSIAFADIRVRDDRGELCVVAGGVWAIKQGALGSGPPVSPTAEVPA